MRLIVNIILFLGLLLSTYFLYLSTTPEGYTGIFIFFKYTVHSMIGPLVSMIVFAAALIVYNWKQISRSNNKIRFLALGLAAIVILVGVFFFMSYKRHNRMPWEKRNVMILVVDTLRADHISAYGTNHSQTPNIDSLASQGWLFERAFAHIPITLPSHSSLFTGRLPHEVNVFNNRDNFTYSEPTLAEIFKEQGFKTMAAISLGVLKAKFNLNRGFDTYLDELPSNGQWYNRADIITDRGIEWLENNVSGEDDRFFMWLHYQDPHEPYSPPGAAADLAFLVNGDSVGEGNIDSAAWVEIPITLKPGENILTIRNQFADEKYRPYFLRMNFRGEKIKDGPFPEPWRNTLRAAAEKEGNHQFNLALDDYQSNTFLNSFEGLSFGGLTFHENGGFSPRDPSSSRPRRYINTHGSMRIVNRTGEPMDVVFRVKGGVNKPTSHVREDYAAEVEYNDQEIGRLLNYMKSRGLMDNTIIVFLADHAEELNEHGKIGHIHDLYTESIHVPLIIMDPDTPFKGKRVSNVARLQDVAPTVLDMSGISIPEYMTGKTLIEYIQRNRSDSRRMLAETFTPEAEETKYGLLENNSLTIYTPAAEAVRQIEYFNLAEDPMQWTNLALGGGAAAKLSQYVSDLKAVADTLDFSGLERKISAEREAMLQDLGYLTSGGDEASLEFIGIPTDKLLDDVLNTASELQTLGLTNFAVDRPFIGADEETGLYYVHLMMDAPEDSSREQMMAVQDHIRLSVLPRTRQFPLRFTITTAGEVSMDRVLGGDTRNIIKLYTLRMMRVLAHQPFPASISPALELSFDRLDSTLSTATGAEPSH